MGDLFNLAAAPAEFRLMALLYQFYYFYNIYRPEKPRGNHGTPFITAAAALGAAALAHGSIRLSMGLLR